MYDSIQHALTLVAESAVLGTVFGLSSALAHDLYRFHQRRQAQAQVDAVAVTSDPAQFDYHAQAAELAQAIAQAQEADAHAEATRVARELAVDAAIATALAIADPWDSPAPAPAANNIVPMPRLVLALPPARRRQNAAAMLSIQNEAGGDRSSSIATAARSLEVAIAATDAALVSLQASSLRRHSVKVLRVMAAEHGIYGRSRLNKAELVAALAR